ncbi:hypothetical protein QQ045_016273 [Rhodiola kirilowii]
MADPWQVNLARKQTENGSIFTHNQRQIHGRRKRTNLNRRRQTSRRRSIFTSPVIGRLQSCSNFLLKLSKTTCSVRNTVDASGGSPSVDSVQCDKASSSRPRVGETEIIRNYQDEIKTEICADIVARVSEAYCFDGMADYQHGLIWNLSFRKVNIPEQVVLKSSSKGKKPDELVQHFFRHNFLYIQQRIFFVDFNVEEVPKVIEWEKFTARNSYQRECQMTLFHHLNFIVRQNWTTIRQKFRRIVVNFDELCNNSSKINYNSTRIRLYHL